MEEPNLLELEWKKWKCGNFISTKIYTNLPNSECKQFLHIYLSLSNWKVINATYFFLLNVSCPLAYSIFNWNVNVLNWFAFDDLNENIKWHSLLLLWFFYFINGRFFIFLLKFYRKKKVHIKRKKKSSLSGIIKIYISLF